MANWETSEYTKTIGIKPEKLSFIDEIRDKKSKAGKLDEIIEFYKVNKKLWVSSKKKKQTQ